MKQALLDSDTISFFFRGTPKVVEKTDQYLNKHGFINISVISYYEIMNGLYYKDAQKQMSRFQEFVKLNHVIPLTTETANRAAKIYSDLRKTGKVIGHNDVMIAAIAIQNDMMLVTNNERHFNRIDGLMLDNWAK